MDDVIRHVESKFRREIPPFGPGDTVQVHQRIKEGDRERVQAYEGVVLARKGCGLQEMFTVRKRSFGVNVEKIFPVHSPTIEEIRVVRRGRVRRAKLYYLRGRSGKAARIGRAEWAEDQEAAVAATAKVSAPEQAPPAPAASPAVETASEAASKA
jgi:large subunit ribosomal protein L19